MSYDATEALQIALREFLNENAPENELPVCLLAAELERALSSGVSR